MSALAIHEKYRFEQVRLASYQRWTLDYINPVVLAAAGFYYTGWETSVTCFDCLATIIEWDINDSPMLRHQREHDQCRFVRKIPCGNVPNGMDPRRIPPFCAQSELPEPPASASRSGSTAPKRYMSPIEPVYESYKCRVESFINWPKKRGTRLNPETLAMAGFFYTGKKDKVMCFHCGGKIRNWKLTHSPWEQHARWYPLCYYLYMTIGSPAVPQPPNVPSESRENTPCEAAGTSRRSSRREGQSDNRSSASSPLSSSSATERPKPNRNSRPPTPRTPPVESPTVSPTYSEITDRTESNICHGCLCRNIDVVYLPCMHSTCCSKCMKNKKLCDLCQTEIVYTLKCTAV